MFDVDNEAITDGPVGRVLLLLAAPLVAQNLVYVANALVDTFWLGRVSEDAVAAVGLSLPIQSLLGAVVVVAAVGTQLLVAQRAGGGDDAGARRVAVNGGLVALAVTAAVAVPVALYAEELVRFLGADPALAGTTAAYLAIIAAVLPVGAVGDTVENCFTAYGDTRAVLHVSVASVLVNLVAAPTLIFGLGPLPALGVEGAALGTVLAGVAGLVHVLAYAAGIGRDTFRLTRDALAVDAGDLREIVSVGLPLGGQRGATELVRVLVVSLVAVAGGAAGVAAYTVGARVATLAVVPALGTQQAAQSMIGQNLGADAPRRARRTATVGTGIIVGAFLALGAVQFAVAGGVVDLLAPDLTPGGRSLAVLYLRLLAVSYWALGGTYTLLAGFNGASRTRTSLAADVLKYWGIRFPIAVAAVPATATFGAFGVAVAPGLGWGVEAVFWAVAVSNVVGFLGLGAYFAYTTRRGMFANAADRARDDGEGGAAGTADD
ncbi:MULTISPECIES: MATE family efflux transporter [unclassified Halorubrum]|uniref:MATE family efflux transporter n=1 Tax=unclassified Halorubrum TaxID=2642239 RepID=UPI000B991FFC|nr:MULTISPECIES: MATE family efflux transporter [unclassified Halorubrum]OYR47795.1 MATE family efflux transporter [Halorubrum sp. Hd13]OYR48667.1 MATE family efflux transporter [Halorubrum sp. Ea8]OYR54499.1 MATE family efflux transporter [Halorubrum sp. Ea1]